MEGFCLNPKETHYTQSAKKIDFSGKMQLVYLP